MIDERLQPISGVEPRAVVDIVFDEIADATYDAISVVLEGRPVAADKLTYRGLDFAFGRDLRAHPFVVLKKAGTTGWPDLVSAPDPTPAG